jgi:hypothetical protein
VITGRERSHPACRAYSVEGTARIEEFELLFPMNEKKGRATHHGGFV